MANKAPLIYISSISFFTSDRVFKDIKDSYVLVWKIVENERMREREREWERERKGMGERESN